MSPQTRDRLFGLMLPAAILLLWQTVALIKSSQLFPGPDKVAVAIWHNFPAILNGPGFTLMRAGMGFAVAVVLMIPLGIFLGRVRVIGVVLGPIMDLLATLPPPAIIPLVMLFVGTGDGAKIVIIACAASVPLLMNTHKAAYSVHPMLSTVARSLHLTRFETMRLIDWPASMPMIVTGARLAIASSLLVSITSEMLLASNGIGVFLQRSQELFKLDAGLAGIAFISLVRILINSGVQKLGRKWLFWHYRNHSTD